MDTQASYEYTALTGSDALRLALLEPSPTISAPLQCSLVSTTLRDCWEDVLEHYIALSYVWGNESDTADIRVEGKRLTITASLDSALRHIRDQKRVVRIWADGISINQADVAERNQQVQQMAAIYKLAKSTIVFLGESTPETTAIFKALPSVSIAFANRSRSVNWHINPDSKPRPQREAIERHILTKPWFYRVWILQEFVLSQDPWIQCGQLRVRWDIFWFHLGYPKLLLELHDDDNLMGGTSPRVANILYPTETQYTHPPEIQFSPGHIFEEHKRVVRSSKTENRARDNFIGMVATREKFDVIHATEAPSKDGIIGPWHTLLRLRRGVGVSDPRDLIYGHLGIISEQNEMAQLQVDYGKSCSELFTEVAQKIIIAENSWVSLLSDVESVDLKDRRPGLPSWVPDWSLEYSTINTNPRQYGEKLSTDQGNFLRRYYSLTNLADVSPVLTCFGTHAQEITAIYPKSSWPTCTASISDMDVGFYTYIHHPTNPEDDALAKRIIKSCESLIENWQKLLGDAVPLTLTPSFISPKFEHPEDCCISIGVLGHLALFDTTSSAPHFPSNATQCIMARLIIAELHDHGPSDYDMMSLAVFNKNYVAMVPKSARPADVLCHFEGVMDLYVLRPAPEKRRINITEAVNAAFDSFVHSKTPESERRAMQDDDVREEDVNPEIQHHWPFRVDDFYFVGQAIVDFSSLWEGYFAEPAENNIVYRNQDETVSDYVNWYLECRYCLLALH